MADSTSPSRIDQAEIKLETGHIKAGAIVKLCGMPFRLKAAVEVESHPDNFNAALDQENAGHAPPRLALGSLVSETTFTMPTEEEIAAYRDLFRAELDKNMHNSSASPSTDAHRVALHRFVEKRNG